jgi:hypothetical protein
MRSIAASFLFAVLLSACGSEATEQGTSLLLAELEGDLPEEERSRLVGSVTADPVEIEFPDGEGRVEVVVVTTQVGTDGESGPELSAESPPAYLRSIEVRALDAAGYAMSAALVGNPTNAGTTESPIHTRLVQITRTKSGLTGSSMSQMTLRVDIIGVTRI